MTHDEKLKDIREHPERHHHECEALQNCCMVNGALDLMGRVHVVHGTEKGQP